ncbi:hypothetical protein N7466_000930 [Penicillium verhagenii]|uniref:uncharacterized protein n=1 Tax=Penicillium verhagenii TaxID=1562060 RepID=UPI0025458E19|nr:uncharacterized protein N7466_000930 [Penicillium verhagenii]KAJ5947915.1 hypothetical protein N7466_000930 [Penicillium verhagenii]
MSCLRSGNSEKRNPDREPVQSLAVGSPTDESTDMKAIITESYLKGLGQLKARIDYSGLASACQIALEGRGPPDFKDQVIATITWQAVQLQRVSKE